MGSRLDARLLDKDLGSDSEDESTVDMEAGASGMERGVLTRGGRGSRRLRSSKRSGRMPSRGRTESTRELVDYFALRMQEARDAWSTRVEALQRRWRASILSVDWLRRHSPLSEKDEALRLTFGLVVRLYAYEDTFEGLRRAAEEDPRCLEFYAPQVRAECVSTDSGG